MGPRGVGAVDGRQGPATGDYEDLYRREYRAVVALVYALSGNRGSAEDLAQEAFAAVHRDWERVRLLDHPAAWLRRVAANLATSAVRRRLAEARAVARLPRPEAAAPLAPLPGDAAEFWAAVRALPRRQAQAVALRYLDELTVAEIAAVLGCAEPTVRVHLHRGRRTLSRRLGLAHPCSGEEDQ